MAIVVEPFNPSSANTPSAFMLAAPLLHEGVRSVEAGDCLVTANGTNLTLAVAAGEVYVKNDSYAAGGGLNEFWKISNSASVNVTLDAADASNPRIDIICAKVDSAAATSARGVDAGSFVAVKGTAAASPSEPAIPSNYTPLSKVTVAAADTSISSGDLEDRRYDAIPIVENGGWITMQELAPAYQSADSPSFVIRFSSQDVSHKFPMGTKIRLKQAGTYKYFIVSKVAFSTHTDVTVYGGTDYTLANSAITHLGVSYMSSPNGFPKSPAKWDHVFTDTTLRQQAGATVGTFYFGDTQTTTIPIGIWDLEYEYNISVTITAESGTSKFGLSTSSTALSDNELVSALQFRASGSGTTTGQVRYLAKRSKPVTLTSKTIYYFIGVLSDASGNISLFNDVGTGKIRAKCALL